MQKPLDLVLPEDWKQRTRVFVMRRKPFQAITPMVPRETYDAERNRRDRANAARGATPATRRVTLK
jgi:hypothetical protein